MCKKHEKRYAFVCEDQGNVRWWEVGNYPDQFDILTPSQARARRTEYERLGHEVFDGMPAFDEAAEARLEEIEKELNLR